MRIIVSAVLGIAAVAAGVAVGSPGRPPPAAVAAATTEETAVRTEDLRFDIYTDNQKVGHMYLKVMAVADAAILDEEFAAPFKGQEAGFDAKVVYRGTGKPVPQSAKAATRVGGVNLMSGTITFTASPAGLTAKEEASGFTDKDHRPLAKPVMTAKEYLVPKGLILTYTGFLFFAPRLLTAPGQLENVVYTEFPADVAFPSLVKYNPDVVLSRAPESADGRSEFTVKRLFPGGNFVGIASMTTDKEGRIVEARVSRYTLVPEGAKPKPAKEPAKEPAKK